MDFILGDFDHLRQPIARNGCVGWLSLGGICGKYDIPNYLDGDADLANGDIIITENSRFARLVDGVSAALEARNLMRRLDQATDDEFGRLFPSFAGYRDGREIGLAKLAVFKDLQAVLVSGLIHATYGTAKLANETIIGSTVEAVALAIGIPKRVLSLINIGLTLGDIPDSERETREILEQQRDRWD